MNLSMGFSNVNLINFKFYNFQIIIGFKILSRPFFNFVL